MLHIAETLQTTLEEMRRNRDNEISMASEVRMQYITDHNDKAAYREADREVNRLAKAWDRMIALLEKTVASAEKIEASCEGFYGD